MPLAKAKRRSRSKPRNDAERIEREYRRLALAIGDVQAFRLYLATYNDRRRRDELIERVTKVAEAEDVRVTRLDLAKGGPEGNLVGLLRAHVDGTKLPPGWRHAVMVTGIEQRLDYAGGPDGFAFLHHANLLRDALPEAAPVPVVLWLSRLMSAALPAEAPDLWHWRAANFDFTGDEAPRIELLRELTTLKPEDDHGFSSEQRRARIRMLKELLAELEREGPPNSPRQAAERAHLLRELGIEAWLLGRMAEAISRFKRALEIFREIGDRQAEGAVLGNLGKAYMTQGKLRRAYEHFEQSLKIAREIGDRRGEGDALGNLGDVELSWGVPGHAIDDWYEDSLAIARHIGDRHGEARALSKLGNGYAALGDTQWAIEHHQQALAIAREIGDRRGENHALDDLGKVYFSLDEPRRAIEHYKQSLAIAREFGDRQSEGATLGNLGNVFFRLGELRRAIEHYEQSLAIAQEIGRRYGEADSLYNSAGAFDQLGDRAEAIRRMEEALRIYEEIEAPWRAYARAQLAEWRGEAVDG